jgi:hypothetical protein
MKFTRILFALLFLTSLSAFAQQDSIALNNIISKTKKLSDEQPIEKVYLHFDKPYYAVADTMWFKAYVTIEQNLPSPLSKIVYVDVFNAKDSLIQTLKLPVKNSVAYGNIPLNMTTYQQGNYYVKAYTVWMLNFDSAYFFSKNITLGEAIDKQLNTYVSFTNEAVDKNIKTTVKIQFKDLNKKVYANKQVNWRVFSNYDEFAKGKGTTDQNGILSINVTSKNGEAITRGEIITDIVVGEKETATANFKLKQSLNEFDFQFFPEGGELISGVPNQVGFKAIKNSGLGADIKGSIIDEQNNEIATFNSGFAGMGSFYLTPENGKSYTAKITLKDGTVKNFNLPKAAASGIGLQITNAPGDFINVKIIANISFFEANKGKTFFVVTQNANVVYYAAKASLSNQVIVIKIPKKDIPSGIAQVTLFNSDSQPLSERLTFVLHPDAMSLALKSDLPTYKPRQKVKLTLDAKAAGVPTIGDFSIAVIDEQKVPVDENNETTILSSLLLTSDLKGYVEKPNYYFVKTDDKKLGELDKLMLTQGYRRFAYKDILEGKYPVVSYLPEQGINITGTLRDLTGMPVRKGAMRLMVTNKPISAETLTSNSGLFNFQNLTFPDSAQVVISAKYNANAANYMIVLDGMPTAGASKNPNLADEVNNIDTVLSAYLSNSQKQYRYLRTLKQIEVKAPSTVKKPSHSDHGSLSSLGQADHTIDGESFNTCAFLLDCLKSRATGLTYVDTEQKFYITRDYNTGSKVAVQVFLNGMPIDARDINTVMTNELESVEIFLRDPLGTVDRLYGTKGVLVINTKKKPVGKKISKQELMDMFPKANVITYNPMGYSKEREFYSPKYLPAAQITNTDLRTTIYWNPKVVTDDKGNVNLEFFNADGKGTYRAVIEGFDKNGNIGRTVLRYTVK